MLTLISAITLAAMDAITKKVLSGSGREYAVGWLRLLMSLPLLIALFFFIERPPLDAGFYISFAAAMPFEILAFVLYIRALKVSPMSLTIPFLAFTPVFIVIVSFAILREIPTPSALAGIILIAIGGYTLNINHLSKGIFEPIKAVARERGAVMMLIVSICYAITSSLGKSAINHSSPLYFGITYHIALTAIYAPFAIRELGGLQVRVYWVMALVGALSFIMIITHMLAMSMTNVAYMIAVKRTSFLFSVLYGHWFFKEENIKERMTGAVLMFSGFVLVVAGNV